MCCNIKDHTHHKGPAHSLQDVTNLTATCNPNAHFFKYPHQNKIKKNKNKTGPSRLLTGFLIQEKKHKCLIKIVDLNSIDELTNNYFLIYQIS